MHAHPHCSPCQFSIAHPHRSPCQFSIISGSGRTQDVDLFIFLLKTLYDICYRYVLIFSSPSLKKYGLWYLSQFWSGLYIFGTLCNFPQRALCAQAVSQSSTWRVFTSCEQYYLKTLFYDLVPNVNDQSDTVFFFNRIQYFFYCLPKNPLRSPSSLWKGSTYLDCFGKEAPILYLNDTSLINLFAISLIG